MEEFREIESELSRLSRVDSPHDFEKKVGGRIAERRASHGKSMTIWPLALKFAAPTILLMLLGAYLFIAGTGSEEVSESVPASTETTIQSAADISQEAPERSNTIGEIENARGERFVEKGAAPKSVNRNPVRTGLESGGSEDRALAPADAPIVVPGSGEIRGDSGSNGSATETRRYMRDQLAKAGVRVACGPDNCRVFAVAKDTPAAMAGLTVGDLIVAIDGVPLTLDRRVAEGLKIRSLVVRKDRKLITIELVDD